MTDSQLKWQQFAGFVCPIFLGWFCIIWMWVFSGWLSNLPYVARNDWTLYLFWLGWIVFVPILGQAMGIISAFCWQHQKWNRDVKAKTVGLFPYCFWFISFPLTIMLVLSCCGWIVFPAFALAYNAGFERGERWIWEGALDKFLGRKNDWERDKLE